MHKIWRINVMWIKICLIIVALAYLAYNITVARFYSAMEMRKMFYDGHCPVGKFCTTVFYLPAWGLKVLKALAVSKIA